VLATLQHDRIRPVAMSRFGEQMMNEFRLDPIYVPHGVDTMVFRPRPEIRDEVRDELDIPRDVFLIGMVAANTGNPALPRKSFPQAFMAYSRFARRHQDAWMYVHTQAKPAGPGSGIALDILAEASGCPPGRLRFPHDKAWHIGMPARTVAALYQAMDVLLMPSMGEGFGIPLLEAQACGVPVITSDHSAMTEIGTVGWQVGGDPWWDALQDSFFIVPSIDGIVAALEAAYAARGDESIRNAAAEFAAAYDADTVADRYWRPALDDLLGEELAA
jgi:glycosyltransferase involved in cell wall biosynthesis